MAFKFSQIHEAIQATAHEFVRKTAAETVCAEHGKAVEIVTLTPVEGAAFKADYRYCCDAQKAQFDKAMGTVPVPDDPTSPAS